jgi:hypothetical protein
MSKTQTIKPGNDSKPPSLPKAAEMISQEGVIDLTTRKTVMVKGQPRQIIGKKQDGVDPGLLFESGMLKFGKDLLSLVKKTKHQTVLEELLAITITQLFDQPASDLQLVLVKTSLKQIEKTPDDGALADCRDEKTIIIPALRVDFNKEAKTLEKAQVISGNYEKYRSGYLRPSFEGINPNRILGSDFGLFGMLNFLFQDPDSIGKKGQNKMLQNNRLFVIDSALHDRDQISIRQDGMLHNPYYKQSNSEAKLALARHKAFRNLSVIDDTPLIEKLRAVKKIIKNKNNIMTLLDNFAREIEKLRKTVENDPGCNTILTEYRELTNQYKLILSKRIESLETTFKYYLPIVTDQDDKGMLSAVIALEELLSRSSRMYSRSGIPLRTVEIPFEDRFFCEGKLFCKDKQIVIKLSNSKEAQEVLTKIQQLLGDKVKRHHHTITCSAADFIKYVTPDRVRLLTHPETISLKTARLEENQDIQTSYFKNINNLLKPFPKLYQELCVLFKNFNRNPQSADRLIENIKILRTMYFKVDAALPKDLLTKTVSDSKDWGALIGVKAIIIKNQQAMLQALLHNNPEFNSILNGKKIEDLFENADFMDISDKLNEVLGKVCRHPELLESKDLCLALNVILRIEKPVADYENFKKGVTAVDSLLTNVLNKPKVKLLIKSSHPAEEKVALSAPPKTKLPLGIKPPANVSAKSDLSVSIAALTQGGSICFTGNSTRVDFPTSPMELIFLP